MARKSTTKQAGSNGQGPPIDSDGYYFLPKTLLMEYRALDSECRHAHLCLRLVGQELDALLAKHPEVAKKIGEKAAAMMEATAKKAALQEVHQMIETIFQVKISDIAIDDLTGRMQRIVEGSPQVEDGKPVMLRPEPVVRTKPKGGRKSKTAT